MKKILLTTCLLLCSLLIQAQVTLKSEFFKYRYKHELTREFTEWSKATKDSTTISLGVDSLVVLNHNDTFRLKYVLEKVRGTDISGDKWFGAIWSSLDKNDVKTQTVVMQYESGIVVIILCYGNIELSYQCRVIKKPDGILV